MKPREHKPSSPQEIFLKFSTMDIKFQVFKYNQNYMTKIGLYFYHSKQPIDVLLQLFANLYFFIFTFGVCVVSSVIAIINNRSNFILAIQASLCAIGGLQASGCYLNIRLKSKSARILHLTLQELVDEGDIKTCFLLLLFSVECF